MNWYEITQRNLIGNLTAQEIVDLEASFPGAVIRNPAGQITQVNSAFQNIGGRLTDGIEFGFTYVTKEYPWGKLDLEFDANYIYNFTFKQLVGANADGTPEHDINDNFKGTMANFSSDVPGTNYVHLIGSWTTFDWQISYQFGAPAAVTPETPKPGYDKEGKRIVEEKAIAPKPEGSSFGWRTLLANTTFTFGINNVFDAVPPFAADWYQGYDTSNANPIRRFFYVSVEKKF